MGNNAKNPIARQTMDTGFLFLQTSPSHPGLVRILTTTAEAPNPASRDGPAADPPIRFVARFNDLDAARLHAFSALRRHLVDLDAGLFRVGIIDAIAAVDSIRLPHRLMFLDPGLSAEEKSLLTARIGRHRRRGRRADQAWRLVGWIAIAWLVLLAISSF
jgi:hypothetical protein